jgi:imidazolonepropionase-like amidohydrolase
MHTIRQYLRCGERILWKKPGFTLTVVLMLALAIGVSTRILGQAGSTTTGDSDKAGRSLALTNVTVIDGNGGKPKPRMTLLISGERIADLFPTGKKQLPPDASVMDLPGYFVTPGFIDSHYHLMIGTRKKEEEEGRRRFALLGGVTSVRDMAGDAIALSQLAQVSASGRALSPRVYFSALMAGPTWFTDRRVKSISRELPVGEAPWARAITPATDLKQAVAEAKNLGVMGIKIYANLTAELAAKITSEAHRQGLKVWGHSKFSQRDPVIW